MERIVAERKKDDFPSAKYKGNPKHTAFNRRPSFAEFLTPPEDYDVSPT